LISVPTGLAGDNTSMYLPHCCKNSNVHNRAHHLWHGTTLMIDIELQDLKYLRVMAPTMVKESARASQEGDSPSAPYLSAEQCLWTPSYQYFNPTHMFLHA
jgi:hypothetical protein